MHREEDKVACGNLKSRIRMTLLYYYSNAYNLLVAGTGDKSEILIGYFTKWGDGAADFRPIEHPYKTQVRWLAKHLGLPEQIATKPSSPGLWRDQLAEEEIGIQYSLLDLILRGSVDLKMDKEEISDQLNIPVDIIEKVEMMVRRSEHKRNPPSAVHREKNKKSQEPN
jgi:NAD+ synthase